MYTQLKQRHFQKSSIYHREEKKNLKFSMKLLFAGEEPFLTTKKWKAVEQWDSDGSFSSPAGISWTKTPSPNLTHVSCLLDAHGMLHHSSHSAMLDFLSVVCILSLQPMSTKSYRKYLNACGVYGPGFEYKWSFCWNSCKIAVEVFYSSFPRRIGNGRGV